MRYKLIKKRNAVSVLSEVLLLLVLVTFLLVPVVAETIISRKLNDSESTSVKKVSVSLLSRGITLIDFKATDLLINGNMLLNGTISKMQVNGIPVRAILLNNEVVLKEVVLWKPEMKIEGKEKPTDLSTVKLNPEINLTGISTLIIYEGNFQFANIDGGKYVINQLAAEVSPLLIDSSGTLHSLTEFSLLSGPASYLTPDSLYNFSVNEIHGSAGNIVFDSVKVIPSYSEQEFTKHLKFQSDRFEFSSPQITVALHQGDDEKIYHFNSLQITQPQIIVFRDKRIERDPDMKFNSLQHYLREMDFNFLLDSFNVVEGDIRYRERMEGSDETGEIAFTRSNINGYRLKSGTEADSNLTIYMNAGFMKSGTISAKLEFPYTKDYFTCKGELIDMPMNELNRITGPNAGVVFNSGDIRSMHFDFRANSSYSEGNLNLKYRDMNFTALNKPSGEKDNLVSRIKTFAAGIFLKRETRQPNTEISLKGRICQERNPERFIFNYIWKSILSGIKSAMTETFTPGETKTSSEAPC